jgi:hypothetical protein
MAKSHRTRARQAVCLRAYARTGSIAAAARAAGIHRSTINAWQKDWDFWQRWSRARVEALEALHDALVDRTLRGGGRPSSGLLAGRGRSAGLAALRQMLYWRSLQRLSVDRSCPQIEKPAAKGTDGLLWTD